MNLRISKSFALGGRARIDAIGEIFNVFNALNPAFAQTSQRLANGVQRAAFMQPTAFAGDFRQPEQRVGSDRVQVLVLESPKRSTEATRVNGFNTKERGRTKTHGGCHAADCLLRRP